MLGLPPLPRTLAAAIRDVSSKKVEVRADAIRDLVRHAADSRSQVIRALEGALQDDDPRVRALAATSLADIGAKEALATLLLTVEDEDAYARQMAIAALGELGDSRSAQRLKRALSDARPEVRFQAVMAFPRVAARAEDALQVVLEATSDDDPLVAHVAVRMLEELAGDGPPSPRALARAKELLSHEAPAVQAAAAILLARAGDPSGREIIEKAATGALSGVEGEDEAAAIELCGELGITSAKEALARRAFSGLFGLGRDHFFWHARVALARLGHERATREILADLASWDRERRTLAVAAAGRARLLAAREMIEAMRGAPEKADPDAVDEALCALNDEREK